MDPISMLIAFGAASIITFGLLLLERSNWGRSKRMVIYLAIFVALAATGAYSWFVLKDLSIAAAIFLGVCLGQIVAKLLDDFIEHFKQSRYLRKHVQTNLVEAGEESIAVDVTHYRRNVLDSVVSHLLRKGHEVGTVSDPSKRVLLKVRAAAKPTPAERQAAPAKPAE